MNAAEQIEQVTDRVLLMLGSKDTRRDQPGAVYGSVSVAEIEAMIRKPACVPKERAPCCIFSTYREHDGRSHSVQAQHGEFIALPGDIDAGNPHITEVDAAIVAAFGNIRRVVYSTSSATPQNRKWRFIIPLAEPIPGDIYREVQRVVFALMAGDGITCDPAMARPGQVVFLPNVPPDRRDRDGIPLFYDSWIKGNELFSVSGSAIEARMIERQRAEEQAREAAKPVARVRAQMRRTTHTGTLPNVIDAFNESVRIEDLLEQYGYRRKGRDWQSPIQTSGSYATRIMDGSEAWTSLSGSDVAAGLGTPIPNGGCWGDAFDLFAHFEHGGDRDAAIVAAAKSIRLPDGRTLDEARKAAWRKQQNNEGGNNASAHDDKGTAWCGAEPFAVTRYSELAANPPTPLQWMLDRMVPAGYVTSLYGPGSIGKSMLAMQLAECVATGSPFMGLNVSRGVVLTMMSEDDMDEQGRRVHRFGGGSENVFAVNADDDTGPCLIRFDARGAPIWTAVGERLEATVAAYRPALAILDPIALLFGGNENDRAQVSAFAHRLKLICSRYQTSILLIGHPAKAEGSEFSGSTAWDTAVRSRLILRKKENSEREFLLQRPKANYAPKDDEGLHLEQKVDGTFVLADKASIRRRNSCKEKERRETADRLVLRFISEQHASGGELPTNSTNSSGVFGMMKAIRPGMGDEFKAGELQQAASRLLNSRQIEQRTVAGKGRNTGSRLYPTQVEGAA